MIWAGLFALTLAGPAAAEEGLVTPALCVAVWDRLSDTLRGAMPSSRQVTQMDGDWCVIEAPVFALDGAYPLVWQADRLRLRGSALGWVMDGTTSPTTLELAVENLRAVAQIGSPQMDWLYAAQARANTIDAALALSWDSAGRVLRLDRLEIDLPGDNLIEASAKVGQVDLSSLGAAQMSLASFAVTEVDLQVRTHGLFEWYVLMTLGPVFLPEDGDMEAAAEALRARMRSGVAGLPGEVFPKASKAALLALIGELPNPSGDLSVSVRSDAGIGPARLSGYALSGMSETVWETGDLLVGATVDVEWTHGDAP